MFVEPSVTSGDYLSGFLQGTRRALYENGRQSITITVADVTPFRIGALIALFERAVGFYASLININAYHQPGVEAGKKAASAVIDLQVKVLNSLTEFPGSWTAAELAEKIGSPDESETVFKICEHLASNPERHIRKKPGTPPFDAKYSSVSTI